MCLLKRSRLAPVQIVLPCLNPPRRVQRNALGALQSLIRTHVPATRQNAKKPSEPPPPLRPLATRFATFSSPQASSSINLTTPRPSSFTRAHSLVLHSFRSIDCRLLKRYLYHHSLRDYQPPDFTPRRVQAHTTRIDHHNRHESPHCLLVVIHVLKSRLLQH